MFWKLFRKTRMYFTYLVSFSLFIFLYYFIYPIKTGNIDTLLLKKFEIIRKLAVNELQICEMKIPIVMYKFKSSLLLVKKIFILVPIHLNILSQHNSIQLEYAATYIQEIYNMTTRNTNIDAIFYFTGSKINIESSYMNLERKLNQRNIPFDKIIEIHKVKEQTRQFTNSQNNFDDTEKSFVYKNIELAYALKYISQFSNYKLLSLQNDPNVKFKDEKYFMVLDLHYHIPSLNFNEDVTRIIENFNEPRSRMLFQKEFMILNIKIEEGCNDVDNSLIMCRIWNLARSEQLASFLLTVGIDASLNQLIELYSNLIYSGVILKNSIAQSLFCKTSKIFTSNKISGKINLTTSTSINKQEESQIAILYQHSNENPSYLYSSSIHISQELGQFNSIIIKLEREFFIGVIYLRWSLSNYIPKDFSFRYKIGYSVNAKIEIANGTENYLDINQRINYIELFIDKHLKPVEIYLRELIITLRPD